jgi:hypothetical protein
MKLRYVLAIAILVLFSGILISSGGIAEQDDVVESGFILKEGKNSISVDRPLYVRELIAMNPEIESVSYFDSFLNKQVGYVNVFGGVGDNFLMMPDKVYEVSVSRELNLVL